jgi:hypothetical protein
LPRISHPSERLALKPRGFALPVAPPDEAASCPAPCILRLCRRRTLELPRVSRPSAHPVVKLRSPRSSILRLRLPMRPRVAPASASSGLAGDGSSSCPESRILQHICRVNFGFPRSLASPVAPADTFPGLPRFLHLPALPATDSRVASRLASFGASGAGASGCPSAPRFQLRLPVWLRVAPHSHTFRLCLGFEFPGLPESSLPWHRLMVPRVASVHAPSGLPSLRPRVAPGPASTAGLMMTSRFSSNFASSAYPRMNLRG